MALFLMKIEVVNDTDAFNFRDWNRAQAILFRLFLRETQKCTDCLNREDYTRTNRSSLHNATIGNHL
jgi:hypothetical protein